MVRGHTPNRRFAKTGLSSVHFGEEEDEEKGDDESSDLQEVRLVAICVVSSSTLLIDVVGWLAGWLLCADAPHAGGEDRPVLPFR
jgi:hypothetical protein